MTVHLYSQSFNSILSVFKHKVLTYPLILISVVVTMGCQSLSTETMGSGSVNNIGLDNKTYNNKSTKLTANNEVAIIRTQMAAQYLAENKLDDARLQLDKALSANRRHAPAYDMMGVLLHLEGSPVNMGKAERFFEEAITLDPHLMSARNNYGVYLADVGRYQEAIIQFEIAGAELGYAGRIGALENLGLMQVKVGNDQLASQAFVRVLESDRQNVVAHIELVDILINSDRIDQAKNLYNELLTLTGVTANQTPRIILQGDKLAQALKN